MNGKNHALVGAAAGVATAIVFAKEGSIEGVLASIPLAMAGAKAPDIDHKNTKQGKVFNAARGVSVFGAILYMGLYVYLVLYQDVKFNPISIGVPFVLVWVFRDGAWFWGHRHGTHTLILPLIFSIIGILLHKEYEVISICIIAFVMGYLSHLNADVMTVQGAPILYPIYKENISLTKVKSAEESKCRTIGILLGVIYIALALIF